MGLFDGILSAAEDVAAVAAAPETGGASLALSPSMMQAGASLIGSAGSYLGTQSANQANTDIANAANAQSLANQTQNQNWLANQRATQYQTAVTDLKAAGLNPMLAYSQGGAGTPSSAPAQVQLAAPRQNAIGNAVSSAHQGLSAMNAIQQAEQARAQTNLIDEQANLTRAQYYNTLDENPYFKGKAGAQIAEVEYKNAMSRLSGANTALAKQAFQIQAPEAGKAQTKWGTFVSPYIKDFTSAASAAKSLGK